MASAPTCPSQLLARKVVVPLSKSKPPIEVEAPAPPHMLETLAACGFAGEQPAPASRGEADGGRSLGVGQAQAIVRRSRL